MVAQLGARMCALRKFGAGAGEGPSVQSWVITDVIHRLQAEDSQIALR